MSLRAQMRGYTVRWATYSKGGFKEGVSLTCDNELDRWQKVRTSSLCALLSLERSRLTQRPFPSRSTQYAYGCSELLFHPMKDWWRRGCVVRALHAQFLQS